MRASPGWFGAEPGFDAPVSGCVGADLRPISAVSASAFGARFGSDAPAPERDASPVLPAGGFARPGPAGPEGPVPLAPGALVAAEPAGGGVVLLPSDRAAWRWAEAGACGLPVPPGAELGASPAGFGAELGDGAFAPGPEEGVPLTFVLSGATEPAAVPAAGWLAAGGPPAGLLRLSGVAGFAPGCVEVALFAVPAGGFAGAGRGAGLVRLSEVAGFAPGRGEGCVEFVLFAVPAGGFAGAGPPAGLVRLSGVAGFPPDCGAGCAEPALLAVPVAGAEAGEFVVLPGPFAGFAPAVFAGAPVSSDEAGPLPELAGAGFAPSARGAAGAGPRVPASALGLAADASAPEAESPVPEGAAFGRCALAMRSVGAADAAGPSLPGAGMRSVAAPGRASARAASAGSALSGAGFFSSFGSDTHTPRQSGTV
ncbi:hypothetical protein ABZ552_00590 [Nocardia sp. NPDC019219]|uniref:hypothetical protein n=1 Tax=Nocardia sp. NPDC019219 TaxID=3154590 RepID=UPI0033CE818D